MLNRSLPDKIKSNACSRVIEDMPPQPVPRIPVHVGNIIPPIFVALSSDAILGRCQCASVPCQTNESLNNLYGPCMRRKTGQGVYCHYVGHSSSTKVLLGFLIYIQELAYADTMKGPE